MLNLGVIQEMEKLLRELARLDLGYPIGVNLVRPAALPDAVTLSLSQVSECAVKWLEPLYLKCNGLSFPDVHIGYFIKTMQKIALFDRSSEPDTVLLDRRIGVLPFGSTGGGDLFVVDCESGGILLLPPGPLKAGLYDARKANVRKIAGSISEFMELLLNDLMAFVNGDVNHIYIK